MTTGVLSGVVRRADGSAAAGASVFLDGWAWPLGAADTTMALAFRSAVQNQDGEWEWFEPPVELPEHRPFRTTADAEGRYAFEESPELRAALDDGRVKLWAELDDQVAPKVVVRAESQHTSVPTLTLGSALRPSVRIVTQDGAPVVDAHVEMVLYVDDQDADGRSDLLYSLGARTDGRGLAVFPVVPDRSDWGVWIRVNPHDMPRHLEMDASLERLRSGEPLDLRISTGFTVRGRVELPDGDPGTGVSISSRREVWDPNPNPGHSTETAGDGSFELRGVPTRDGVLEFVQSPWSQPGPPDPEAFVSFPGDGASSKLTMRVQGREGQVVDLGTVRLAATLTIRGKVLGPDGKPPKRGYVRVDGPGSFRDLEPDGSFEVASLEPGKHKLTATVFEGDDPWEDGVEASVEGIEAGSSDVLIRVTGGGNLVLRFHAVGRPDEPLEVSGAGVCWDGG